MNAATPLVRPCHTLFGPVFVLGEAHSGSRLVGRLLDHLGVNCGTESQFVVRYHRMLPHYGDLSDDSRLRWLLDDISRERFFWRTRERHGFALDTERALRSVGQRTYPGALWAIFEQFATSRGHVRWGDQTPGHCGHLPMIRELFPDAQFLHVVRDGRDVAHSLLATGSGPANCYEAALAWRRTLREVERFRETLPADSCTEIRYEELVDDPVRVVSRVARFLGIANAASLVDAIEPSLHAQVRSGSAATWKRRLSWREVECFEAFAGDELAARGYTLQFRRRHAGPGSVEIALWEGQALCRRAVNRRYRAAMWNELRLRAREAVLPLRAMARLRVRDVWRPAQRSAK